MPFSLGILSQSVSFVCCCCCCCYCSRSTFSLKFAMWFKIFLLFCFYSQICRNFVNDVFCIYVKSWWLNKKKFKNQSIDLLSIDTSDSMIWNNNKKSDIILNVMCDKHHIIKRKKISLYLYLFIPIFSSAITKKRAIFVDQ